MLSHKRILCFCFFLFMGIMARAQYFDTLSIHYAIGDAVIDKAGQQKLDSLILTLGDKKILIYSYADYLGTEQPNYHLSESRALGVKQYLITRGIKETQVMQCTGLGQVNNGQESGSKGDYESRRSDIFVKRAQKPQGAVTGKYVSEVRKPAATGNKKIIEEMLDLEVDQTLRMENISFYPGRAVVLPSAYPQLEGLYNTLAEYPNLKVQLEGHVCCCTYPDGYLEDTPTWMLSVERSITVYKYLIDKGITPERLRYKGFGRTRPIRDNERTSAEGQINRRVEVRILEK